MYPSRFGYIETKGALHPFNHPESRIFYTHTYKYFYIYTSKYSCPCYGLQSQHLTTAGWFLSQRRGAPLSAPRIPHPAPRAGVRPAARACRKRPEFFSGGKRFLRHRAGCPPSRRTGKRQASPFPLPPHPRQWRRQKTVTGAPYLSAALFQGPTRVGSGESRVCPSREVGGDSASAP